MKKNKKKKKLGFEHCQEKKGPVLFFFVFLLFFIFYSLLDLMSSCHFFFLHANSLVFSCHSPDNCPKKFFFFAMVHCISPAPRALPRMSL